MTEWIAVIPPGDTCTVQHADVSEASVVEVAKLDAWAKLEAARREYERLAAELGSPAHPSLQPAVEDAEEVHRAFKVPGPRFACRCNNVYDHHEDLIAHEKKCGVAARHRNLGGHAEEGGFRWGVT